MAAIPMPFNHDDRKDITVCGGKTIIWIQNWWQRGNDYGVPVRDSRRGTFPATDNHRIRKYGSDLHGK
jgi:hypothetical protein